MRGAALSVLLLLTGCAFWSDRPEPVLQTESIIETAKSSIAVLDAEVRAEVMSNKAKVEESKRKTAEARDAQSLRQLRMFEQSDRLSKGGLAMVAVGVLAFLFAGPIVPRWASAITVTLGLFTSTFCYQVLEFLGSDVSMRIMTISFSVLAGVFLSGVIYYLYDWLRDHT